MSAMVAPSLRMPVAGRSVAGISVLVLSGPLCRLTGLTENPRTARRLGATLAAIDLAGAMAVAVASTSTAQRKAAYVDAALDVVLATALLGFALRRHGRQRLVALAASASVWFGAAAWMVGADRLDP
jgi:hypothetical protein